MVHVRCQKEQRQSLQPRKERWGRAIMVPLFRGLVAKCGGHNRLRSRLGCSGVEGLRKDTLSVSLC